MKVPSVVPALVSMAFTSCASLNQQPPLTNLQMQIKERVLKCPEGPGAITTTEDGGVIAKFETKTGLKSFSCPVQLTTDFTECQYDDSQPAHVVVCQSR